jgi:hypothetical protein
MLQTDVSVSAVAETDQAWPKPKNMVHAFFPEIKLDVEIQRFLLEIESALRFLFSTVFCVRGFVFLKTMKEQF